MVSAWVKAAVDAIEGFTTAAYIAMGLATVKGFEPVRTLLYASVAFGGSKFFRKIRETASELEDFAAIASCSAIYFATALPMHAAEFIKESKTWWLVVGSTATLASVIYPFLKAAQVNKNGLGNVLRYLILQWVPNALWFGFGMFFGFFSFDDSV